MSLKVVRCLISMPYPPPRSSCNISTGCTFILSLDCTPQQFLLLVAITFFFYFFNTFVFSFIKLEAIILIIFIGSFILSKRTEIGHYPRLCQCVHELLSYHYIFNEKLSIIELFSVFLIRFILPCQNIQSYIILSSFRQKKVLVGGSLNLIFYLHSTQALNYSLRRLL